MKGVKNYWLKREEYISAHFNIKIIKYIKIIKKIKSNLIEAFMS